MKLLITGATGFVGRAVSESALLAGHGVTALVRNESALLPAAISQIAMGDFQRITDATSDLIGLKVALSGIDVVIHTAARAHVMHEYHENPSAIYKLMNVTLTERLAEAAAKAGVKRFVFLSSVKVNGEATFSQAFTESDTPIPKDAYGQSKWDAEQVLMAIGERTGMEVVILRPPLVYGPGVKGNFANLIKLMNKNLPLPLGAVNNKRSLLALDNLISAILLAVNHPAAANQTFLLADNGAVSTSQLLKSMAAAQSKRAWLIPIPVDWMKAAAKLIGKQTSADRLFGSLEVDTSKIRHQLGWEPVISMTKQLEKMR